MGPSARISLPAVDLIDVLRIPTIGHYCCVDGRYSTPDREPTTIAAILYADIAFRSCSCELDRAREKSIRLTAALH